MLAKVLSSATLGIDAYGVEVEVDVSRGLPSFSTVGLPDNAVKESKDRVKSAIRNSGYSFPAKRITVNLAPADIRKEGTAFDLPVAVGILKAEGIIAEDTIKDYVMIGELSLDGGIRPVRGALSVAVCARGLGRGLLLPSANAPEAAIVDGLDVYGVDTLSALVEFLNGRLDMAPASAAPKSGGLPEAGPDLSDVKGQEHVKRAVEVAAAGSHNILMIGPPGSGKTMIARRLPGILPEMSLAESIETTKVHSVAGLLGPGSSLVTTRPFRAPHHTISDVGLTGGGRVPKPGEVSLAHNGVLFLDELPEFRKGSLEVLRQPVEDGHVAVVRAQASVTYPSVFMLVGAMNPCPCGFLGDPRKSCRCTSTQVQQYRARLSGPLLDRIDIHCEVPAVDVKGLGSGAGAERSADVRKRVDRARSVQAVRYRGRGFHSNSRMGPKDLREFCRLGGESEALINRAVERLGLSARAYTRVLKVARTIADLDASDGIQPHHVSEAVQYRTLDRAVSY